MQRETLLGLVIVLGAELTAVVVKVTVLVAAQAAVMAAQTAVVVPEVSMTNLALKSAERGLAVTGIEMRYCMYLVMEKKKAVVI